MLFENAKIFQDDGQRYYEESLDSTILKFIPEPVIEGRSTKPTRLLVSFTGLVPEINPETIKNEKPWAYFLKDNGFALLGFQALANHWYRPPDLLEFIQRNEFKELLASYDDVLFYGGSMGGYAALAFSSLRPGSRVLAYSPQVSLHPVLPRGIKDGTGGARI